ncbi:MAG: tRNA threonylcarbamoyladenosine dehydratase [Bacilli bacterium]|nr:tRNA threonylcarbamoyladenosine dehydratase [Bacilli bacterium]
MQDLRFQRTELLIKKEGLEKLQNSRVLVFGLGGVGSYVVEALARGGVGTIGICDMDSVNITNINRQIIALTSTIGKTKVEVSKERMLDINPNINVIEYPFLLDKDTINQIDFSKFDFIVDAIDMVPSKILLIRKAHELNIKIISSMGTANKLNPQDLCVTDLAKTHTCPLAKKLRYELKKYDIKHCKVVYSTELPISNESNVLGSVSFVPSTAGLLIASEVIKEIIKE